MAMIGKCREDHLKTKNKMPITSQKFLKKKTSENECM